MARRKTNEEFVKEIYDLVGDEYEFLEEYIDNKTKIKCIHNKCGHEWSIVPFSFLRGSRCPKCARLSGTKKRTKYDKKFSQEVYDLVGKEYTFLEEYINAKTKIMCRHNKCGYEWGIQPDGFLNGSRCPKCNKSTGKYKKTNEEFIEEVYNLVKYEYIFLEEYVDSCTNIKCKHNKCGHTWWIKPNEFLRGRRCPKCAGVMIKTNKEFTEEVYNLTENEYTFLEEYINNRTKIKCRHNICDYEWEITPTNFLRGARCPLCASLNMSKGESKIGEILKNNNIKYIPQHTYDGCKYIYPLLFDFYLPDYNLLIEYDGEQHFEPVNFGGCSNEEAAKNFKKCQERDKIKNQYCKDNNIPLLRIPYWEFDNIERILEEWLQKYGVLHKDEKSA